MLNLWPTGKILYCYNRNFLVYVVDFPDENCILKLIFIIYIYYIYITILTFLYKDNGKILIRVFNQNNGIMISILKLYFDEYQVKGCQLKN